MDCCTGCTTLRKSTTTCTYMPQRDSDPVEAIQTRNKLVAACNLTAEASCSCICAAWEAPCLKCSELHSVQINVYQLSENGTDHPPLKVFSQEVSPEVKSYRIDSLAERTTYEVSVGYSISHRCKRLQRFGCCKVMNYASAAFAQVTTSGTDPATNLRCKVDCKKSCLFAVKWDLAVAHGSDNKLGNQKLFYQAVSKKRKKSGHAKHVTLEWNVRKYKLSKLLQTGRGLKNIWKLF